jgi:hypothetical protein
MHTDEITKGAEKILAGFGSKAEEISPVIANMLERISKNNAAFDLKKREIEKELDSGARTTQHRLHL